MNEEITEPDFESPEAGNFHEDYYRKNLEEIRAAVTRGATGIEASYFFDQRALLSLEHESSY